MARNAKPPESAVTLPRGISKAAQTLVTVGAENTTVVLCNSTTSHTSGSNLKAVLVTLLAWLLAWRPAIAIRLGKLVLRMWPDFKRA